MCSAPVSWGRHLLGSAIVIAVAIASPVVAQERVYDPGDFYWASDLGTTRQNVFNMQQGLRSLSFVPVGNLGNSNSEFELVSGTWNANGSIYQGMNTGYDLRRNGARDWDVGKWDGTTFSTDWNMRSRWDPTSIDNAHGFGGVDYKYLISDTHVTAAQYAIFLNATATEKYGSNIMGGHEYVGDPRGLWHPYLWRWPPPHNDGWTDRIAPAGWDGTPPSDWTGWGGDPKIPSGYCSGILRVDAGDRWEYIVLKDWADKPVDHTAGAGAMRFTNWLTTGNTESGVYSFDPNTTWTQDGGAGGVTGIVFDGAFDAADFEYEAFHYRLPTQDEFYKAAYYDPTLFDGQGGYWLFGTQSNDKPDAIAPGDPGWEGTNVVAWNQVGKDHYGTNNVDLLHPAYAQVPVGSYPNSLSFYGLLDASGNLSTYIFDPDDVVALRGGHIWHDSPGGQSALFARLPEIAEYTNWHGFRVVMIPEPGSAVLLAFGALGLLLWRRRRN